VLWDFFRVSTGSEGKKKGEEQTNPLPPPNLLTTLCTIGISLPLTLYTTTSPTFVSKPLFQRNSKSPRWKAGSMEPDRTTTIGEEESVVMERPFQSMNAVLSTRAKFRIWVKSWRGWREVREENMAKVLGGVDAAFGCGWEVATAVEMAVGVGVSVFRYRDRRLRRAQS
jgi:hypothetical protein